MRRTKFNKLACLYYAGDFKRIKYKLLGLQYRESKSCTVGMVTFCHIKMAFGFDDTRSLHPEHAVSDVRLAYTGGWII